MSKVLKFIIKKAFRRLGYDIHRRRTPPASGEEPSVTDAFHEQRRFVGRIMNPVIFDVGAHHGQTSLKYKKLFPSGQVYAFEPFPVSYRILRETTHGVGGIHPLNLALGDKVGVAAMSVNKSSATNSLLSTDPRAFESWNNSDVTETIGEEKVDVSTVDGFLTSHEEIEHVNILKLDAQGSEYAILRGAENAARAKRIDMIYLEMIIMPTYIGQKELDETLFLLRGFGFKLHNFFNPCFTNDGRINQVDAIFVREELAKTN